MLAVTKHMFKKFIAALPDDEEIESYMSSRSTGEMVFDWYLRWIEDGAPEVITPERLRSYTYADNYELSLEVYDRLMKAADNDSAGCFFDYLKGYRAAQREQEEQEEQSGDN